MYAKKSLGQHFLRSTKALSQIVNAANLCADDTVLEIGPGEGVLTERLLAVAGKVIAIEKDRDLIPVLQERFATEITEGRLILIQADILTYNPQDLPSQNYKLVANIPYYITGAIIEQFLSTAHQPTLMVLLMQKEVADRIVAKDKKGSVLSIAIAAYGKASIVDKVPPGAFAPAPTVDSAILLLEGITRDFFIQTSTEDGCDEQLFFSVLKSLFGKKRKQLGGSLSEYLHDRARALSILETAGIDPKTRPEELSLQLWKKLVQTIR